MTPAEALRVLRKAVAYQPTLKLDDLTADVWAEVLADVEPDDGLDAVARLGREPRPDGHPWLFTPAEVRQTALAMARARLASRRHLLPDPPRELADRPIEEARWLADRDRAAMARDWQPPTRPQLEGTAGQPRLPQNRADTLRALIHRHATTSTYVQKPCG